MSLKLLLMTMGGPSLIVSAHTGDADQSRTGAQCFSGVEFNTSGVETRCTNTGSYIIGRDNWLDAGDSSEVWIERVINSGSLNSVDPGAGRLQLSTSRRYEVTDNDVGVPIFVTCNLTFNFYDAAAGGNLLDSVTIQIQASWAT